MTQISVVIGTYNQAKILPKTLDAFATQTLYKDLFEVIVVDSSSHDGTAELFKRYSADFNLRIIIQENKGKAAARNRGVQEAQGSIILITDADMIADSRLLERHVSAHKDQAKPACFEGLTYNMTKLHWPPESSFLYPYIHRHYKPLTPLGWYYFLTGNLSMPKELFLAQGGFDENFTGYGWEDLELGYRLSKQGVPLFYLPTAINYHYHVVSQTDEISRNIAKGQSAKYFLQKHPNLKWFLGANPFSVWLFRHIKKEGLFFRMMNNWYQTKKNGFALWLLKEYHYLQGLLS